MTQRREATVRNRHGAPRPTWAAVVWRCAWLVVALLASGVPRATLAHDGAPLRVEPIPAGPYTLAVQWYNLPHAGEELVLRVIPVSAAGSALSLEVQAVPGAGAAASPVRGKTVPDGDQRGAFAVTQALPVTGAWTLVFTVNGAAGSGVGRLAVTAAAPGAAPAPLGWAIALTPLVGLLAFGVAQWRWYRARPRQGIAPTETGA